MAQGGKEAARGEIHQKGVADRVLILPKNGASAKAYVHIHVLAEAEKVLKGFGKGKEREGEREKVEDCF